MYVSTIFMDRIKKPELLFQKPTLGSDLVCWREQNWWKMCNIMSTRARATLKACSQGTSKHIAKADQIGKTNVVNTEEIMWHVTISYSISYNVDYYYIEAKL